MSLHLDRKAALDRCADATPGPWLAHGSHVITATYDSSGNPEIGDDIADTTDRDAEFIAHARRDLPGALALLSVQERQLAEQAEQLERAHRRIAGLEALLAHQPTTEKSTT